MEKIRLIGINEDLVDATCGEDLEGDFVVQNKLSPPNIVKDSQINEKKDQQRK